MVDKEKLINCINDDLKYLHAINLWAGYIQFQDRILFLKYLLYRIQSGSFDIKEPKCD